MSYASEYYKKRYQEDKEFREMVKGYIMKYQKTEKGKDTARRAREKRKRRYPDYMGDYCRKRRENAIKNGICTYCYKRKAKEGKKQCSVCCKLKNKYARKKK